MGGRRWRRLQVVWIKDLWVYYSANQMVLILRGFRGWCVASRVVSHRARVPAELLRWLESSYRGDPLRKIKVSEVAAGSAAAEDKSWGKSFPHLLAFLVHTTFDQVDGGGPRETGTLSVWASAGQFHMKLIDKASGHCAYVAGSSWVDLLTAADATCSDPAGGWKPDLRAVPRKKR